MLLLPMLVAMPLAGHEDRAAWACKPGQCRGHARWLLPGRHCLALWLQYTRCRGAPLLHAVGPAWGHKADRSRCLSWGAQPHGCWCCLLHGSWCSSGWQSPGVHELHWLQIFVVYLQLINPIKVHLLMYL